MVTEGPFVIAAEKIEVDGNVYGVPLGVELAACPEGALKKALRRWPYHMLLEPLPWEEADPEIRLAALDADMGIRRFRLPCGASQR